MLLLERRGESTPAPLESAAGNPDIAEAETLLLHARETSPDSPEVLVGLAELSAYRGDLTRALELYEGALQRVPQDSPQHRIWQARAQTLGR